MNPVKTSVRAGFFIVFQQVTNFRLLGCAGVECRTCTTLAPHRQVSHLLGLFLVFEYCSVLQRSNVGVGSMPYFRAKGAGVLYSTPTPTISESNYLWLFFITHAIGKVLNGFKGAVEVMLNRITQVHECAAHVGKVCNCLTPLGTA